MVLLGKSIRNGLIQHPKSVDLGLMFLPRWLVLSIRYNPRSRGWSWYTHFLFLTFSVGKRNHVGNRWVLGDQGMSRMDYAPSAAKLPQMALELDWTCRDCLWLFFVFVKIFRLCPVVTSAQMSAYVGWATWLCGSISAYEMAKLDLHLLCLTGEGVTLSAPRSMLGYDLRKLVSERLPCKPAAELAVHHVNRTWRWIEPWESKGLENQQCCPALTYQQMCSLHGVMSVGSRLVRENLS